MKSYYDVDEFQLFNSDCVKILDELEENSVDMIFADPPYNLSNGGFTCQAGKRVSVNKGKWDVSRGLENDFQFYLKWIDKCKRVLKENGTIWISGTYHSIYSCGYALQICGYHILNDISWFKPNASPNLSTRYFTASHETIIWARKNVKGKHKFNYKDMKMGQWPEDQLKKPNKQMRSVWSIPTPKPVEKKFGKHATQKPFELMVRIVLASTDKDDLVLDPFTGSSTTGLAAYLNGRRFIGIDIEKEFLDLSIRRFEFLRNQREKLEIENFPQLYN